MKALWLPLTVGTAALAVPALESWFWPAADPASFALVLNAFLLVALIWGVLAVTNRTAFSIAFVLALYAALALANDQKIRYLIAPVHPADLFSISDALRVPLWQPMTLAAAAVVAGVGVLGLGFLVRRPPSALAPATRVAIAAASALVLGGVAASPFLPAVRGALGASGISWDAAKPALGAQDNGLLADFVLHVGDLFPPVPDGYDEAAIRGVVSRWTDGIEPGTPVPAKVPPNVVLYVVEALVEPGDLGWTYTAPPAPFFTSLRRSYSSGFGISSEFGGRSANVEFEILTGLSAALLPPETIAYNRFVHGPLPALPRFLGERGYRTVALHVDSLSFFNYRNAYRHLGFESVRTLLGRPGVELDPAGRVATDVELVRAVLDELRGGGPAFVFAFANSTHLPYDYPSPEGADLDVVEPLPDEPRRELRTYLGAIRAADRALELLIEELSRSTVPTVVAVLGDHFPGLSPAALSRASFHHATNPAEEMLLRHRCPVVLWSNRPQAKEDFELSFNFLAQRIIEETGIAPTGYWRWNRSLASRFPILSRVVRERDGEIRLRRNASPEVRRALEDYALLQHDLLTGKRYAIPHLAASPAAPGVETRVAGAEIAW